MPEVIFTGPAGRLEGRFHQSATRGAPIAIILLALAIGFFSVFGNESYAGLQSVKRSLALQKVKNARQAKYVEGLKRRTLEVEHEPRALEKAARDELGMARPHELIFIFDEEPEDGHAR